MTSIVEKLERAFGVAVSEAVPLSGGDLSTVVRFTLADGRRGVAKSGGDAHAEAAMLRAIADAGAPAPEVLAVDGDMLAMTALPAGGRLGTAWDDLARLLGRLHAARGDRFGWDCDYAFGSVAIANGWRDDWPGFWAENRLACHLPHLPPALARRIERLAAAIDAHLPAAPVPSLLHGDLWGGNVLVEGSRISGLIDPACYYGDREVDAAMLTLFDSPPSRFFDALELEPGWRERQPVYRLWPLLVHVRLFGGSYEASASAALADLGY